MFFVPNVIDVCMILLTVLFKCFLKGDKIHATVKKELVHQFEPFLGEGLSKIFINFSLNHACGSYRSTNHPYKISFISTTRVKICEHLPRAISGLKAANFHDILDGTLNPDFLVGKYD